ncbi:hypothetical protein ACJ8A3_29320, partial [Klebsiella pneumoniae]
NSLQGTTQFCGYRLPQQRPHTEKSRLLADTISAVYLDGYEGPDSKWIYHNASLRAPLRRAQGVSGGYGIKQATTPGKLPETRPINFILMHAYARNCMAYVLT